MSDPPNNPVDPIGEASLKAHRSRLLEILKEKARGLKHAEDVGLSITEYDEAETACLDGGISKKDVFDALVEAMNRCDA